MANTFKQATKSSLNTDAISSANTNIFTSGGSSTLILLSAMVANKTSSSVNVDLYIVANVGDNVYLLKDVPVPAGSSLEVLSGGKVVVQNTDVIKIDCDVAAKIDATLSIMEMT